MKQNSKKCGQERKRGAGRPWSTPNVFNSSAKLYCARPKSSAKRLWTEAVSMSQGPHRARFFPAFANLKQRARAATNQPPPQPHV